MKKMKQTTYSFNIAEGVLNLCFDLTLPGTADKPAALEKAREFLAQRPAGSLPWGGAGFSDPRLYIIPSVLNMDHIIKCKTCQIK